MNNPGEPGYNADGHYALEEIEINGVKATNLHHGEIEIHYSSFEPDGELFAKNATVHIERMDKGHWWMSVEDESGNLIHVNFWSRKRIHIHYEEQGNMRDAAN